MSVPAMEEVSHTDQGTSLANLPPWSVLQVFGNPMLLEMILEHTVFDWNEASNSRRLSRTNLRNLRGVSLSWKESVTKVLEKSEEPLFTVTMTAGNSLKEFNAVQERGKILDNFVSFLKSREDSLYKAFRLKLSEEVFRQETYDHLLTCLGECGQDLVELELTIPQNGGTLLGLFPNTIVFSSLQKMTIDLTGRRLKNVPANEKLFGSSANLIFLLQSLLTKSQALKELSIEGKIPSKLQFMEFPASLTTVYLECDGNAELLQCLIRNKLPNLKELTLRHCLHKHNEVQVAEEHLLQLMQKLGSKLRILELLEYTYEGPPRAPIHLRFPVIMENLEELDLRGLNMELEAEIPSISTIFPKLKSVTLWAHNAQMLSRWTASAPVPRVTKLALELVNEQRPKPPSGFGHNLAIPLKILKRIHVTFPNVTDLTVCHSGTNFAGLRYIFQKMRHLKRFNLVILDNGTLDTTEPWDSLFTRDPSIRMLTELTSLSLEAVLMKEGMPPLISNLTFTSALNGMTKLDRVHLSGRFKAIVSDKTVEEWKQKSRRIVYVTDVKD